MSGTTTRRRPAGEAEGLVERLRVCAYTAVEAVRAGDVERLHAAMKERALLMARAEPLLDRARAANAVADPDARAAGESLLLALRGAQAADAQLASALAGRRDAARDELSRMQKQESAPRYQRVRTSGRNLDLRR